MGYAVVAGQASSFPDEPEQAGADLRIGKDLAHVVVEEDRIVFPDLRVFQIVEIVREFRRKGARLAAP